MQQKIIHILQMVGDLQTDLTGQSESQKMTEQLNSIRGLAKDMLDLEVVRNNGLHVLRTEAVDLLEHLYVQVSESGLWVDDDTTLLHLGAAADLFVKKVCAYIDARNRVSSYRSEAENNA